MKKTLLIICFFIYACYGYSQNPSVKLWDHVYGGTGTDFLTTIEKTLDGGAILGGFSSSSASGSKSQSSWGGYDFWVVKIDTDGNKQWDKDFGGTADDRIYSIQQTKDHGYLLGGISSSGLEGDKTQPNWDSVNFSHDFWVVKIDSLGNKKWDKRYGGTANEYLYSVQQTTDGGYILGGSSVSDAGGDKSEGKWDSAGFTYDFWVVKTDSVGNKEWDKDFGGTEDDGILSARQTPDGGYFLAGTTASEISGDKTSELQGLVDYYLIKTNSLGDKLWEKDFGGTLNDLLFSMELTTDGGAILGGASSSGISGTKTQSNWDNTNSTNDYWMVKVDSVGNAEWDKALGGTDGERGGTVSQTIDGGYLMSGISYSEISGNKTENNLGIEQTWVVKTDSIGTAEWDKTIFTTTEDECGFAVEARKGCYFVANYTHSDIGGYKSEASIGFEDFWALKFCDSASIATEVNLVEGNEIAVSAYPNPFTNSITIDIHHPLPGSIDLKIVDVAGRVVFASEKYHPAGISGITIFTSQFSNGIYFLDVTSNGERKTMKLVKQQE